ncbi:MAG: hypothetical protein ACHQ6T_06190 [Myxococcota bacterium]
MADLHARYESWREARERARLERARGLAPGEDAERIDDEFGDVTSGDIAARFEGRFATALAQAALARALRAIDARIEARAVAGADPAELDELHSERIALRSARLAQLGFASARAFAEAQRPGVDYAHWRAQAQRLLAQSGPALHDAERAPGAGSSFDAELPGQRMRAALDFALEGLRLELGRLPSLRIDAELRPEKRGLAQSGAPRVPEEVWLVFAPLSGARAHQAVFAAAGVALHSVFTSSSLPLERRVLGDPALALGFGELLRGLMGEPSLGAALARVAPEHFDAVARLLRLAELRQIAARVPIELELAELPPGAAAPELGEPGFLTSCGPALSSVDQLRAACLGASLAAALRARFGREYWKSRGAGELLKELWNTGTTYSPEELARELSQPAPSADVLLEREHAR